MHIINFGGGGRVEKCTPIYIYTHTINVCYLCIKKGGNLCARMNMSSFGFSWSTQSTKVDRNPKSENILFCKRSGLVMKSIIVPMKGGT